MKKIVATMTACGSSTQNETTTSTSAPSSVEQSQGESYSEGTVESAVLEPEIEEETPSREELIKQYVGRYVLVDNPDGEAELFAERWNRGDYRYIEITADCQYFEGAYEARQLAGTPTEYYFDPIDCSVHWVADHEHTLYTVSIEDGVLNKSGWIYAIKD